MIVDKFNCALNAIYNVHFDVFRLQYKGRGVIFLKNKRMKIARMECDLSQEQLAEMVGVTRQTIGLIESGKYNPTLKLCVDICKALNKTLNELFWEE